MKNITYRSASAGSGKTYSQTELLSDIIISGKALPEEIIMTTFTNAAANDLKEKAKEKMYAKAQMCDNREEIEMLANRLDQAMIGTIDSICKVFVKKYWYALGLSPNVRVIDENEKKFIIDQSLSSIVTEDDLQFFNDFKSYFGIQTSYDSNNEPTVEFWQKDLKIIAEKMTLYKITSFDESIDYSLKLAKRFVSSNANAGLPTLERIQEKLDILEPAVATSKGSNIKDTFANLKKNISVSYGYMKKLRAFIETDLKAKKNENVRNQCMDIFAHIYEGQDVYDKQEAYIRRLFGIAQCWNKHYEEYKKSRQVFDFTDMEHYMYLFLTEERYAFIKDEISQNYKYLFVDEFQDCSPLQVRIFDCLSDVVSQHSYWVGDSKQAIYGFRDSDAALTEAVVKMLSQIDGCEVTEPLDVSYRSVPAIVNGVNKVFVPAFHPLAPKYIELKTCEKKEKYAVNVSDSLRLWKLVQNSLSKQAEELAMYVLGLKQNDKVDYKDIAILGRTGDHLDTIAGVFLQYGIPVDCKCDSFKGNKVFALVKAILKVISNPYDNVAKTEAAFYTQRDLSTAEIIDQKLAFNSKAKDKTEDNEGYLDNVSLLKEIADIRPLLNGKSVKAVVDIAIAELDIFNYASTIAGVSGVSSSLQAISDTAADYEQKCADAGFSATIDGFIEYAEKAKVDVQGDADGVHLITYHGAKGLQWKYVILTDLNTEPNNESNWDKNNYSGVNTENLYNPSGNTLYPSTVLRLQPWIFSGKSLPAELIPRCDQNHRAAIANANIQEAKRLMYVGMTRAEDVLIFAVCDKKATKENPGGLQTQWLDSIGISLGSIGCVEGKMGVYNNVVSANKDLICLKSNPCVAENRDIMPSSAHEMGKAERVVYWNKRLSFPNLEDNLIGDCIHTIFCGMDYNNDLAHIKEILSSFAIEPKEELVSGIVAAWEQLTQFLTETYGAAKNKYHELAFKHKTDNGQIVTGSMDFVWETAQGVVLIDYKTCQMGVTDIEDAENKKGHYAGMYKGQFDCYATALKKHGKTVLDRLVFYPSICLVERIL